MQLHAEPLSTNTCMIFIVVPDTIVSVTEVYLIILWSVTTLCVVDVHVISDYVFFNLVLQHLPLQYVTQKCLKWPCGVESPNWISLAPEY